MLKPVLTFAALGLGGLLAVKLFLVVLPVVGMLLGIVLLGFKFLVIAGLVWLAYRLFQKAMKPRLSVE